MGLPGGMRRTFWPLTQQSEDLVLSLQRLALRARQIDGYLNSDSTAGLRERVNQRFDRVRVGGIRRCGDEGHTLHRLPAREELLRRAAGAGAPQLGKLTAQRGDLLPQRPHALRQLVRRPLQRVRRGPQSRLDRLAIP